VERYSIKGNIKREFNIPKLVIIGGGMTQAGDFIFTP